MKSTQNQSLSISKLGHLNQSSAKQENGSEYEYIILYELYKKLNMEKSNFPSITIKPNKEFEVPKLPTIQKLQLGRQNHQTDDNIFASLLRLNRLHEN